MVTSLVFLSPFYCKNIVWLFYNTQCILFPVFITADITWVCLCNAATSGTEPYFIFQFYYCPCKCFNLTSLRFEEIKCKPLSGLPPYTGEFPQLVNQFKERFKPLHNK